MTFLTKSDTTIFKSPIKKYYMKPELYVIQCKSNLHVGSGDSSYGVIDKLVQRDTADSLPCIYSSSLKGAFREYFEEVIEKGKGKKVISDHIFGEGSNKSSAGQEKGTHIFQQAFLLSMPLRSNQKPFYNSIAPFMVKQLLEMALLFGYKFPVELQKELEVVQNLVPQKSQPIIFHQQSQLEIEDFSNIKSQTELFPELQNIIGQNIVVLNDEDMKRITNDYHLPIIARNKLENGKSKNLWYEQVVPRESVFTAFVATDAIPDEFQKNVNKKIVQIGGDSSVGYGYSLVFSLPKIKKV